MALEIVAEQDQTRQREATTQMPRRSLPSDLRVREEQLSDPRLRRAAKLFGELVDEQCDESTSFLERSRVARRVAEELLSDLLAEEIDDAEEREDPEG